MSIGATQVRHASDGSAVSGGEPEAPHGYRRTEVGVVPEDWEILAISELFEFLRTASNSRADLGPSGTIAYVHYGDIHTRFDHFIDFTRDDVPRLVSAKNPSASRLRDGDLIVADASEDEEGVGKSVEVRNLGELEAVAGLHTILLRPRSNRSQEGYRAYLFEKGPVRAQLERLATGLKVFGISKGALKGVQIPLPPPHEQRAIAEALSDVDGLLRALEALIAKKRAIKQAAMGQLLTGRTRLPGFSGEWGTRRVGELAAVNPENLSSSTDPGFSFNYISLEQVDAGRLLGVTEEVFDTAPSRARRMLRHDDVLMSTVRPNLMAHLHFKSQVPKAVCSTGFAVLRARSGVAHPGFLFAQMFGHALNSQIEKILAGSNYPAINSRDVRMIDVPCPPTVAEQTAIATILSDMDAEIAALEGRRDKTRAIKQGMMQHLLTGRVRLVALQTGTTRIDTAADPKRAHSWAFNEAVVISTLAQHFGEQGFALGRKRYQKLAYLLHRHVDGQGGGYLKKAAGPYNPSTRYGGPERIALEKGYIRRVRSGRYTGFLPADEIAEAVEYFEKWYGRDVIEWLEQFRYAKNDELELLTAVDLATEELRAEGMDVDVPGVKSVISSHPEWEAKLDRAVFSDRRIAEAIEASKRLFGSGGVSP